MDRSWTDTCMIFSDILFITCSYIRRYWILKRPLEVCANLAMQTTVTNLGPTWPTKNSQRITKNPSIFIEHSQQVSHGFTTLEFLAIWWLRGFLQKMGYIYVYIYRYSSYNVSYIMFYLGGYKATLFRAQVSPCSNSLHTLAALSRADSLARKSGDLVLESYKFTTWWQVHCYHEGILSLNSSKWRIASFSVWLNKK